MYYIQMWQNKLYWHTFSTVCWETVGIRFFGPLCSMTIGYATHYTSKAGSTELLFVGPTIVDIAVGNDVAVTSLILRWYRFQRSAHRRTPGRRVRVAKWAGDAQLQGGGQSDPDRHVVPRRTSGDDGRRQSVVTPDAAADRAAVLPARRAVGSRRSTLWRRQVLLQGDQPSEWQQRSQPRSFAVRRRSVSSIITRQEAQLPQRNRATRYLSKFVLCFTKYGS